MHRVVLVALALFAGCDCGGVDVGEQTITTKAVGLWLTSNPLEAPPGSLSEATNAAIRRNNVVEPRRGQEPDAAVPTSGYVDAMASFEGALIVHTSEDELGRRVSDTTITAYSGTFPPPEGNPARFVESAGGLYVTTDSGPFRLDSPSGDWERAGAPPGLEGSGATTGSTGWLPDGDAVAYRLCWGLRDSDGALIVGAPSGRFIVTNSSGGSRDVAITTPLPDGIAIDRHFLQVFRTVNIVTAGNDPGEDMALVLEVFPTATQIAAGEMTVTDIASFANGPAAYFSPSQGVGLTGAKDEPPLIVDAVEFNGYLFGAVQAYAETINLSILGIGSQALSLGGGITVIKGATEEMFAAFTMEDPTATPPLFELFTTGTAAENIEDTTRSLVRVINEASDLVYATYVSGPNDLPGMFQLRARTLGGDPVRVLQLELQKFLAPQLQIDFYSSPTVTARVSNVTTVGVLSTELLTVGMEVTCFTDWTNPTDEANFPTVTTTVASIPTSTTFTIADPGPDAVSLADMRCSAGPVSASAMVQAATPASFAFSDYQEPDAWPPRFRFQCPGPNTVLYRILPQGNALLFFTSAGLYRMTGKTADEFALFPMDPTVALIAPRTAVTVANRAFAVTEQGVVSVTDLGVEWVGEPIDELLRDYYAGTEENKTLLAEEAFAAAYETEGEYLLFLPPLDADPGTPPNRAYVYNTKTGTWVGPWEVRLFPEEEPGDPINLRSGWVHVADGRLYIGAGDMLTRERKDRALTDYQDADGVGILVDVATVVNTSKNPAAYKQWTEVTALLEQPQPASCEMYFTTEIDSTEEGGTLTTQGAAALRTYIPLNKSRSARLTVGIRHSTAGEKLTILGFSTVANVVSTKVSR